MDWELLACAGLALAIVNIKFEPTLYQRTKIKLMKSHRNKEPMPVRPVFPVKRGDHVSRLLIPSAAVTGDKPIAHWIEIAK